MEGRSALQSSHRNGNDEKVDEKERTAQLKKYIFLLLCGSISITSADVCSCTQLSTQTFRKLDEQIT